MKLINVFLIALRLGVTSFGGPIAHVGYFRQEYVARRGWLDDKAFNDLVALCQLLPGPTSSQLGIAIGTLRTGRIGGFLAWFGFTMPSALILIALAYGVAEVDDVANSEWLHGLKLAVVAVVGLAVWSMAGSLWTDRRRITIGIAAAVFLLVMPGAAWQIAVIVIGALAGVLLFRNSASGSGDNASDSSGSKTLALVILALFFVLLVTLPVIADATGREDIDVFENFYRSGSLVFGGGHVVLPLIQAETVGAGYVDNDQFVAGYGATQAVPGPLFTFASYLGAAMDEGIFGQKWIAGLVTLVAIYVPSFLLVWGVLPFWTRLSGSTRVRGAIAGSNAAVVGLLLAALYDPIWTGSVFKPEDFGLVIVLFGLLTIWKMPPWSVVIIAAAGGYALAFVSDLNFY
ncbi:MAG TPA: chromate efflux transporter [Dehalococcoidia bacterium]|nr:chromate efflux transporter [Dehalococcoidia bacterium]